jgi:23S rRNA (cytosine1962-C5)-methyltransferase
MLEKHIILRPKEERRVLDGHPWVFSNEVKETKGSPQIGDVVELVAASGKSLGVGFYNPHSLIAFRLLSQRVEEINAEFFEKRIVHALALRRKLYPNGETFRLVYSESDFLPGLIVDKFNEFLSVQTVSYGMDARLTMICDVLENLLHPKGIAERNESHLRELEKLPQKKGVVRGAIAPTIIEEADVQYRVNVLEGQKTGFFLDQRENRILARRFCGSADVLDCFCNDGGFALHAAKGNAKSVLAVDSSADAMGRAEENARLNNLTTIEFERADVFEKLKSLARDERKFDVVILDPPSFTKSRKNVTTAKQGYKELQANAFRVLKNGGFLLTASCSHHIESDVFLDIVDSTARRFGRQAQLLQWRGAAPDHPVLPAMPETRYLKFGVFRICN